MEFAEYRANGIRGYTYETHLRGFQIYGTLGEWNSQNTGRMEFAATHTKPTCVGFKIYETPGEWNSQNTGRMEFAATHTKPTCVGFKFMKHWANGIRGYTYETHLRGFQIR